MKNLSNEITFTLSLLSRMRANFQIMYRKTVSITSEIDAMNPTMPSYGGQVRTKTAKFRKEIDEEFEKIVLDLSNYSASMTDIIQNKNSDSVIYLLNRYSSMLNYYKSVKNNAQKLCDLIKIKKEFAERKSDYVRVIAMHKILIAAEKQNYTLDQIIKRLEVLLPS